MNTALSSEALEVARVALVMTLQGMAGIFVVMGLFAGLVVGLERWFRPPG